MSKRRSTHAMPIDPGRPTAPQAPGVPPAGPTWRPIDFVGEDTSLTQEQLALLK